MIYRTFWYYVSTSWRPGDKNLYCSRRSCLECTRNSYWEKQTKERERTSQFIRTTAFKWTEKGEDLCLDYTPFQYLWCLGVYSKHLAAQKYSYGMWHKGWFTSHDLLLLVTSCRSSEVRCVLACPNSAPMADDCHKKYGALLVGEEMLTEDCRKSGLALKVRLNLRSAAKIRNLLSMLLYP